MSVRVPRHLIETDPARIAAEIGLRHVSDSEPGLRRRRCGRHFSYLDANGDLVDDRDRRRVEELVIPPAWESVWISPHPLGYLQATGVDEAGRKQYRYHARFREHAEQRKFERLAYFGRALATIRRAASAALDRPIGTSDHAVAAAVTLIDRELLRVGNDRSASEGHHGATTLTVDHVVHDGYVVLEYTAKSGTPRTVHVEDDDLSDVLLDLAADADDELFWFDDGDQRRRATACDINGFIARHGGPAFSAKDFRTWGGSRAALEARLAGDGAVAAADAAADELGNTRATARNSYIHPVVLSAEESELERSWRSSRRSRWFDRTERTLLKLIG